MAMVVQIMILWVVTLQIIPIFRRYILLPSSRSKSFLGADIVQSCRWTPMFQNNRLPPFLGLKSLWPWRRHHIPSKIGIRLYDCLLSQPRRPQFELGEGGSANMALRRIFGSNRSFIICSLHQIFRQSNHEGWDGIGSTYGRYEKCIQNFDWKSKKTNSTCKD
jgi:hypothetical protein